MKEPLRIRVLDALEYGPATAAHVAEIADGSLNGTRDVINRLIEDGQVEQVDAIQGSSGQPHKVYAIRGSVKAAHIARARAECHALNAQERMV